MEIIVVGVVVIIILFMIKKMLPIWSMQFAGKRGEWVTYFSIKGMVKRRGGIIYKNIKLPLYDTTTEIDLLIISSHGILCIENKHVTGTITGSIKDKYWNQSKSWEEKQFYNPIFQNEGHIKCLNHHLITNGLKNVPLFSFIVFSNKKADVKIKNKKIGDIPGLKKYLKKEYFNNRYKTNVKKVIDVIKRVKS